MLKNVKSDRFATLPGVTKNYGGLDSSQTKTKTKKKIIEYEYYDEDYDYYDDFYVPAQPRRRQSYGGGGKLNFFYQLHIEPKSQLLIRVLKRSNSLMPHVFDFCI